MNRKYRVRSHDKYGPNVSRIELLNEEEILEATLIVPNEQLKDFPVDAVINVATEVVEKAPDRPKQKQAPFSNPEVKE